MLPGKREQYRFAVPTEVQTWISSRLTGRGKRTSAPLYVGVAHSQGSHLRGPPKKAQSDHLWISQPPIPLVSKGKHVLCPESAATPLRGPLGPCVGCDQQDLRA